VLPYALCYSLCPVSAALASIFRMDSIPTSYSRTMNLNVHRGLEMKVPHTLCLDSGDLHCEPSSWASHTL